MTKNLASPKDYKSKEATKWSYQNYLELCALLLCYQNFMLSKGIM
jgi:hypothetical protein